MVEIDVLEQIPLFSGLTEVQLGAVAARGSLRRVADGEVVFEQHADGTELFVLLRGRVQVTIELERATEQVPVHTVVGGHVFGEFALLAGMERSATARATEDCELFVLAREDFEALAAEDPQLGYIVVKHLSEVLVGRLVKTTHELRASLLF